MFTGGLPSYSAVTARHDALLGPGPVMFWGNMAPDGDAGPWLEAALGSLYVRSSAGAVALYVKTALAGADADWVAASLASHDHDSDYSALSHDHDSDYSALSHDHDSDYSALSHTHT